MSVLISYLAYVLGWLMRICSKLTVNYGLIIIIMTLISKIIMLPISFFVHKNSIKMVKMQPELNHLQAQFIHNKDQFAEEQLKVFKKEKYNVFAGIIPLVIQILLIIGLIRVMYNPLTYIFNVDPAISASLDQKATEKAGYEIKESGSSSQLRTIEYFHYTSDIVEAEYSADELAVIEEIRHLEVSFFGIHLSAYPLLKIIDVMWLFPLLAGLSSFLLSYFQNKLNVLQKEQSFISQWGMAIFLMLFSLYFGFVVAAGVALYWIASNLFSTLQLFLLNAVYSPERFIDYEKLEASKEELKHAQASLPARAKLWDNSPERQKEKADYKRFFRVPSEDMQLVFYSEQSGFYKYFKGYIEYILANSNIIIHYVTSDPHDMVFGMNEPRLIPYYIGEAKLIYLMMKIQAKVVVMTMPDLQTYHIKRSLVRKDVEYIFVQHGIGSINMLLRAGAVDNFDTIFACNTYHTAELRLLEEKRGTAKKRILKCGYPLLDDMIVSYNQKKTKANEIPTVLIAPSWSEDNILDSCLDELLASLLTTKFRLIVRPHPQFIRNYPDNLAAIMERYKDKLNDDFVIETDFSSNETVYSADLLITDWSSIAYEYSFTTKKPTLFINTKIKIMNEDYERIEQEAYDIRVRNIIGVSLEKQEVKNIGDIATKMIEEKGKYAAAIQKELNETFYHIGESATIGGNYIVKRLTQHD